MKKRNAVVRPHSADSGKKSECAAVQKSLGGCRITAGTEERQRYFVGRRSPAAQKNTFPLAAKDSEASSIRRVTI